MGVAMLDYLDWCAYDELAPKIVELCSPLWAETGKLYDFPLDKVLPFRSSFEEPSA